MDKIKINTLQGQQNYHDWKFQVENMLKYYGLTKIINGESLEEAPPAADASAQQKAEFAKRYEQWMKNDCHVMALLTSTMEREVRDQFRICKTSKEVWDQLKLLYEQKSNQRLDLLYCELFNSADTIIVHVTKLRTLWQDIKEELASLDPTNKMPDSMLVSRILHTLTHEEFVRFNNTWGAMPANEQTIEKLTELLRLLEVRIEQHSGVSDSQPVALKADGCNRKLNDRSKYHEKMENGHIYKPKGACYVCGSTEHQIKDCTDPRKRNSDYSTKKEYKSERKTAGYIGCVSEKITDVVDNVHALVNKESDKIKHFWIADSGCNKHIIRCKDYYVTYENFDVPKVVRIGNISEVPAYGRGTIYVEMLVHDEAILGHLDDVWYVPGFVADIFSVGTCLDKGYE